MKSIVIYTSNTGYTKQYAEMLSKDLNCQAVSRKQLSQVNLNDYNMIIYGGGIRANKISGFKSVLKKLENLKDQKVIVFAVGATEKSDVNTTTLLEKNIKENHVDYPLFYFQGGFDPSRLSPAMRFMLNNVKKSILKKQAKNPASLDKGDKDFLDFFQSTHENIRHENLEEIIQYVNQ